LYIVVILVTVLAVRVILELYKAMIVLPRQARDKP
jgi:hypothetical protein